MAFGVICAAGGGAPTGPDHGTVNFDYSQAAHPLFAPFVAPGPGAATGLCLGLTMEWLHNWRRTQQRISQTAYRLWVAAGIGGTVHGHSVAVFGGPAGVAGWPAITDIRMTGLGFTPVAPGGLSPVQPWMGAAIALQGAIAVAPFIVAVATGPNGSHAMGIFRAGVAVLFFDANHGELHFPNAVDFSNWFANGGYQAACLTASLGAPITLRWLRYT